MEALGSAFIKDVRRSHRCFPFRRAYTNALCRRADLVSRLDANSAITETPLNWLLESGPLQSRNLIANRKPSSVRCQRLRPFHGGDPMPNGLLHLLEGAPLDLPHSLARDAEFLGQIFERNRLVDETARLEDA